MEERTAPHRQRAGMTILVLFQEEDRFLWNALAPHLRWLEYRLAGVVHDHPLPLPATEAHAHVRRKFLPALEQTDVCVPCTSAALLDALWELYVADPRLTAKRACASVVPISLRAASCVKHSLLERPLEAYAGGERDQACVEVVTALEKQLHELAHGKGLESSWNTFRETVNLRWVP